MGVLITFREVSSGPSPSRKADFLCANESPMKMVKHFRPYYFGHLEKRINKKTKVNFKFYDVINWETNYYNIHIA